MAIKVKFLFEIHTCPGDHQLNKVFIAQVIYILLANSLIIYFFKCWFNMSLAFWGFFDRSWSCWRDRRRNTFRFFWVLLKVIFKLIFLERFLDLRIYRARLIYSSPLDQISLVFLDRLKLHFLFRIFRTFLVNFTLFLKFPISVCQITCVNDSYISELSFHAE